MNQAKDDICGHRSCEDIDVNVHLRDESAVASVDLSTNKSTELLHCTPRSNTKTEKVTTENKKQSKKKTKFPTILASGTKQTMSHQNDKENRYPSNHVTIGSKRTDYISLKVRLESFTNWPKDNHLSKEDLSEAGFYYTNNKDRVKCFLCGGRLQNWDVSHNVWVEHARWFPVCDYVCKQMGEQFIDAVTELNKKHEQISYEMVEEALNLKLNKGSTKAGSRTSKNRSTHKRDTVCQNVVMRAGLEKVEEPSHEDLNIVTTSPKYFCHSTEKGRRETFRAWPKDHPLDPCYLPAAGFYYEGTGDCTRCYHCGGALRNWLSSHNAFVLHAKWFPNCTHIRMIMGPEFVDKVHKRRRNAESSLASLSSSLSPTEMENVAAGPKRGGTHAVEEFLCKICVESQVNVTFLPCGHLVTCVQCGAGADKCPMCNKRVEGRVRTKYSLVETICGDLMD